MEFRRHHRNLNVFLHFGSSAENENNTTRALIVVMSHAPWGAALLRSFLDLLRERARLPIRQTDTAVNFLSQWPESVEFSLERAIDAEGFPSPNTKYAVLVGLTPDTSTIGSHAVEELIPATGRVDAIIVLRDEEGDELAIVIESKLYGDVGEEQWIRYKAALEHRGIKTIEIKIPWEEVYKLADCLPEEAKHDPILSDFMEFLDRDPRLIGFTKFKVTDFCEDNQQPLDRKLGRFCQRITGDATSESPLFESTVERKKGGLDYDIYLRPQAHLIGNIGLAAWGAEELTAKLVFGYGNSWHTDQLMDSRSNALPQLVGRLKEFGRLTIDARLRPHFGRFDYQIAASLVLPEHSAETRTQETWTQVMEFARRYHRKPLTRQSVDQLKADLKEYNDAVLERAMKEHVKCFVAVGVCVAWEPQALGRRSEREQIEVVRSALSEMAQALQQINLAHVKGAVGA